MRKRGQIVRVPFIILGLGAIVCAIVLMVLPSRACQPPKNVVLLVADALRPDHLGCYGYTRMIDGRPQSLTPNLDKLADEGTLFENCMSQSNWTRTSVASLLYSVNPTVRTNYHSFDYLQKSTPRYCLLSALPKTSLGPDYDRACVQTNANLIGTVFTSLFDIVMNTVPHPFRESPYQAKGPDVMHADAGAVNRCSMDIIDAASRRGRSVILYAHYMEVHEPYRQRPEYKSLFGDKTVAGQDWQTLREEAPVHYAESGGTGAYDPEFSDRLQRLTNDYDACLMYLDSRIGELVDYIDRRLGRQNTMIIVAADHAQELGEHGNVGHGQDMYDEQIHVPLIIAGAVMPAGVRVRSFVRNIDIMPTVCDYLEFYPKCDGESLQGVAEAAASYQPTPDREVFACSDYMTGFNEDRKISMLISESRVKYILTQDRAGKTVSQELYDLKADPRERHNVIDDLSQHADSLRAKVEAMYLEAAPQETADLRPPSARKAPPPAVKSRLRDLGYLN